MTTQELKQYIDKVLGNSIRCLLPSYWWKRAFGAVIDNTISKDEVKTINGESVIGGGNLKVGVTTVGSIDELNTLEASVGDIATVGEESTMLVRVGDLQQVDDPSEILEKWDNLTRIVKVEVGEPVTEIGYHATVYLNGKKPYGSDTILISSSEVGFLCRYGVAGEIKDITIEEVNEMLKKRDYRFMMGLGIDDIDNIFKLHADSSSANAYIKGNTWERLAKESDIQGGESGGVIAIYEDETSQRNADAYNKIKECHEKGLPINAVVVKDGMSYAASVGFTDFLNTSTYVAIAEFVRTTDAVIKTVSVMLGLVQETGEGVASKFAEVEAGDEPIEFLYLRLQNPDSTKEHNAKVFQKMNNSFVRVLFNDASASENGNEILCATYGCSYVKIEDYFMVELEESFSSRVFKLTSDGTLTFEYRNTHADSELSETSTNPVQNKVIKEYVDNAIANAITTTLNTAV